MDHRLPPWNDVLPAPSDALEDTTVRVLLAAMSLQRPTVRAIAQVCGWSLGSVHEHLKRLRAAGLIAWEDGCHGTMRVLVHPALGQSNHL